MDYVRNVPVVPDRGSATGRALLEGVVVHIADVTADPGYTFSEAQRLGDFRTILGVPMIREGVPIGVIVLTRTEARPFTNKQIDLALIAKEAAALSRLVASKCHRRRFPVFNLLYLWPAFSSFCLPLCLAVCVPLAPLPLFRFSPPGVDIFALLIDWRLGCFHRL